jgi:hypothetical protein
MHRNAKSSLAFIVMWSAVLLIVGYTVYKNVESAVEFVSSIHFKTVDEMMDGNH